MTSHLFLMCINRRRSARTDDANVAAMAEKSRTADVSDERRDAPTMKGDESELNVAASDETFFAGGTTPEPWNYDFADLSHSPFPDLAKQTATGPGFKPSESFVGLQDPHKPDDTPSMENTFEFINRHQDTNRTLLEQNRMNLEVLEQSTRNTQQTMEQTRRSIEHGGEQTKKLWEILREIQPEQLAMTMDQSMEHSRSMTDPRPEFPDFEGHGDQSLDPGLPKRRRIHYEVPQPRVPSYWSPSTEMTPPQSISSTDSQYYSPSTEVTSPQSVSATAPSYWSPSTEMTPPQSVSATAPSYWSPSTEMTPPQSVSATAPSNWSPSTGMMMVAHSLLQKAQSVLQEAQSALQEAQSAVTEMAAQAANIAAQSELREARSTNMALQAVRMKNAASSVLLNVRSISATARSAMMQMAAPSAQMPTRPIMKGAHVTSTARPFAGPERETPFAAELQGTVQEPASIYPGPRDLKSLACGAS